MKLVPDSDSFSSRLRSPEVAARIGVWLGICFGIAFVTGLISHAAQDTPSWLTFPTRPVSLYRITQGLHVTAGTAAVPLLLAKLWTVYPRLFDRLALHERRRLLLQLLERGSIAVLVAAAIFQLATGLANSSQWYPWSFSFRPTHYAVAWIAIGALLVHIAVKLPLIRQALTGPLDGEPAVAASDGELSRRGFLRATWLAAGVAVLATAGATVPALRKVSLLAVRSGEGPQGLPINRSAEAAGVTESARHPSYRLEIRNGDRTVSLTRADLEAMSQTSVSLPIACVEGWSAGATWSGVRVRELLARVGAPADSDVGVESLERSGAFNATELPAQFAADDLTLLALKLNGETLDVDHGYPCRIIAPDRPGVLQTKWVSRLTVRS